MICIYTEMTFFYLMKISQKASRSWRTTAATAKTRKAGEVAVGSHFRKPLHVVMRAFCALWPCLRINNFALFFILLLWVRCLGFFRFFLCLLSMHCKPGSSAAAFGKATDDIFSSGCLTSQPYQHLLCRYAIAVH